MRELLRSISTGSIYALLLLICVFSLCAENGKKIAEQKCDFEISEVYLSETEDVNYVLLTIKGVIGPNGFYKYVIHFPPQAGTDQGIGPIEVGEDEPCRDEKRCKPLDSCQKFIIREFIARSYPDNVPEFGKSYYATINFYLNDDTVERWEGKVNWKSENSV